MEEAAKFKRIHNLPDYIECSSKTGQNIDLVFHNLVYDILKVRGFIN